MEAVLPYIKVNFIVFFLGGIFAPICLMTLKYKSLHVYLYEWLVLIMPVVVFRLIWSTQLAFKSDGNIGVEPFIIGLAISGLYGARYYYREAYAKAAPICFCISCLVPIVVYLCMPVMPN